MSRWTDFVKDFAKRNNVSYGCALSMPECSAEYREKNPKKLTKKQQKVVETQRKQVEETKTKKKVVQADLVERYKPFKETMDMRMEDKDAPAPPKPVKKVRTRKIKKKVVIVESDDDKPTPKEVAENITMVLEEPKKRGRKAKYASRDEALKAKKEQTKASNKRRYEEKKKAKQPVVEGKGSPEIRHKIKLLEEEQEGSGFITNTYKKVANFGNQVVDVATKVVKGRQGYSPKVQQILEQYGDQVIGTMTLNRTPVPQFLITALSIASMGEFEKRFKNTPYDKLFHLRVDLQLDSACVSLEKNEVINMDINPSTAPNAETQVIQDTPQQLTINQLLENARTVMGDTAFFKYSAKTNNCQDFITAVLKASSIGTQADYDFVKQDTEQLFGDSGFLSNLSDTLTDLGSRFDVIKQGGGVNKKDVLKQYDAMLKHLTAHIADPKEPIDPRDFKQSKEIIDAIGKVKGKGTQKTTGSDSDSYDEESSVEGGDINFEKLKEGAFTKQLKAYNNKHNKSLSMDKFAKYVDKHPNEFNKTTHRRALFYLNVLARKSKK